MLHEHELNARAALVKVHDPTSAFPAVTRGLLSIPVSSIPEGYEDMLQKRITALEDEARALKNRKNALVPINRLPHEILSTIFQTTKSLLKYTYPQPRNRLTWVRVSHVCRYWREVALDAASLWSYLDFPRPDPEFTRLMLQRSKNAPLTVDHRGKVASFQQEAVREALSEPHRLRSAYLSITGNSIPFVLSKSPKDPGPPFA
ncbi:hypothetical protein NMY22_g4323 [Coprinellus aureogranulatus]|nr:hypothetical protein NMY22_g4323 [Coprinellus aureogranulatus]